MNNGPRVLLSHGGSTPSFPLFLGHAHRCAALDVVRGHLRHAEIPFPGTSIVSGVLGLWVPDVQPKALRTRRAQSVAEPNNSVELRDTTRKTQLTGELVAELVVRVMLREPSHVFLVGSRRSTTAVDVLLPGHDFT
jgi:hypothetical protein